MMSFAAAVDAIYANDTIAMNAVYTPAGGGESISVRVIKSSPDQALEFNSGQFVSDSFFIDVRVSEVEEPQRDDTFTLESGETVVVISDARRDTQRLVWKAEVREQV